MDKPLVILQSSGETSRLPHFMSDSTNKQLTVVPQFIKDNIRNQLTSRPTLKNWDEWYDNLYTLPNGTKLYNTASTNQQPSIKQDAQPEVQIAASQPNTAAQSTLVPRPKWQARKAKDIDTSSLKYTIKAGDTLWEIAKAYTGSGANWKELLKLNPGSDKRLLVGQEIKIPALWKFPQGWRKNYDPDPTVEEVVIPQQVSSPRVSYSQEYKPYF